MKDYRDFCHCRQLIAVVFRCKIINQKEWVYKPSSVPRHFWRVAAIYLDQLLPVGSAFQQATYPLVIPRPSTSFLVLQAVGFALPMPSPAPRCALTAPFHRCLFRLRRTSAVYFLWHFPAGHPGPILQQVAEWEPAPGGC